MKIRKGKTEDAGGCIELQKLDKEDFWKEKDFINSAKNKYAIFLIAEQGKQITGFVLGMVNLVKRDEAYLQETRVDNRKRHQGIGTKLVNAFCKEAKKKGVKEIFSEIETEHIPFYIKSCKFKDRGKHVLIMKKL
jgi:N-acetylglutamate synthase-like GNAT family acetyltransferase